MRSSVRSRSKYAAVTLVIGWLDELLAVAALALAREGQVSRTLGTSAVFQARGYYVKAAVIKILQGQQRWQHSWAEATDKVRRAQSQK